MNFNKEVQDEVQGNKRFAGIGIGKAVIVGEIRLVIAMQAVTDVEEEVQRFKGALDETIKATEKLAEDLATRVGEKEAEIMQGHMMLLADPMLTGEIENSIRNDSVNSEYAIENVCNMYADMFASMGDELMQQRATDMRDIKTRMQQMLMGIQSVDISSLPEGSIIVAKDLTPSMTAGINPAKVTGIVTELGGRTSHSAILARALEIPAVVAVTGFMDGVKDGDQVVLDGSTGEVYVNPDQAVAADYEEKRKRFLVEKRSWSSISASLLSQGTAYRWKSWPTSEGPRTWIRCSSMTERASDCSAPSFCLWTEMPCLQRKNSSRHIRRWLLP